jgi:hypothetical protein
MANVAGYYYSFFILLAPFTRASWAYGAALIGVATASSALVCIDPISRFWDDRYAAQSVVFLLCALGVCGTRAAIAVFRHDRRSAST